MHLPKIGTIFDKSYTFLHFSHDKGTPRNKALSKHCSCHLIVWLGLFSLCNSTGDLPLHRNEHWRHWKCEYSEITVGKAKQVEYWGDVSWVDQILAFIQKYQCKTRRAIHQVRWEDLVEVWKRSRSRVEVFSSMHARALHEWRRSMPFLFQSQGVSDQFTGNALSWNIVAMGYFEEWRVNPIQSTTDEFSECLVEMWQGRPSRVETRDPSSYPSKVVDWRQMSILLRSGHSIELSSRLSSRPRCRMGLQSEWRLDTRNHLQELFQTRVVGLSKWTSLPECGLQPRKYP